MNETNEPPPPTLEQRRRLRLSGKSAAIGLVVCFALTAILIPAVLKLPIWIDFEIVLAIWWGIWLIVLTSLLYQGQRVTDDHQMGSPRNWLGWMTGSSTPPNDSPVKKQSQRSSSGVSWFNVGDVGGDGEGCLWLIGMIVALIALFFAVWFLIEVAIPLVLFILYLVVRGMLSRVINDRHRCKGLLGRSLVWAMIWATAYTAPLAGVVWCVHWVMAQQAPAAQ